MLADSDERVTCLHTVQDRSSDVLLTIYNVQVDNRILAPIIPRAATMLAARHFNAAAAAARRINIQPPLVGFMASRDGLACVGAETQKCVVF